ncbi:uncharacterized protein AMSG_01914 [Thecamonas trahens ATCC 50062]|uniref:Tyrosine-protein kinase ephrin type A/B receptor-like domain-containing protein n=1 Tax=Thecamonas trahens ATCC 50062 TaxID=461836 RepID=A0A0L0DTR8_THETB|nr:hypothetical protein AMSG_01914 [Thecamonas trahens ATCC 50062]KNC55645.1 hypothetical protein AMSG_01914 [Thecamonas trahens ATCC 50062]|eukprot:XP_013761415.1 hypothetical protein AMSG_01914 [Thecamonas trahens ATCC 50062]
MSQASGTRYSFAAEPTITMPVSSLCTGSEVIITKDDAAAWVWPSSVAVVDETTSSATVSFASTGRHTIGTTSRTIRDFVYITDTSPPHAISSTGTSVEVAGVRVAAVGASMTLSVASQPAFTGFYEWTLSGSACSGTHTTATTAMIPLPTAGTCNVLLRIGTTNCGTLATATTVVVTNIDTAVSTTTSTTPQTLEAGQTWSFSVVTKESGGTIVDNAFDVVGLYDNLLSLSSGPVSTQTYIGSGEHDVTYTNTVPGDYVYTLRINLVAMATNPYEVTIVPGPTHGPSSYATGLGITNATVGTTSQFVVVARDAYSNLRGEGGDIVTATLTSPDHQTVVACVDNDDGTYICSYNPSFGGTYVLSVNIAGLSVGGSPWPIKVLASCELGYLAETEFGPCTACPLEGYNDVVNAPKCKTCPVNTIASPIAPTIFNCSCVPGFFHPERLTGFPCLSCPEGAVCAGGTDGPVARPGWHPATSTADGFIECSHNRAACAGGSPFRCANGYAGRLCGECAPGYYKVDNICRPCDEFPSELMFFFFFMFGLFVCAALAWFNTKTEVSHKFVALVIGLNALQVVAIYGDINLDWPEYARSIFDIVSFLNINLDLASPECSISASNIWLVKWAVMMAMPAIGVVLFGIVYLWMVFYMVVVERWGESFAASHPEWMVVPSDGASRAAQAKHRLGRCLTVSVLKHRGIVSTIGRAYFQLIALVYLPLVAMTLKFFECVEVERGDYVMASAPAYACYDSVYWRYFPAAVIFALLYCIGIPVVVTLWLRRKARILGGAAAMEFVLSYGFMIGRYRTRFYLFETAIMARKLAIVVCVVAVEDPLLKASIVMLLLSGIAVHSSYIQPYVSTFHNRLESWMLCMAILALWGGTVTYSSGLSQAAIITGLSLLVLSIFFGIIFDFYRLRKKEKRAASEVGFSAAETSTSLQQDEDDAAIGGLMETFIDGDGSTSVAYANPVFATVSDAPPSCIGEYDTASGSLMTFNTATDNHFYDSPPPPSPLPAPAPPPKPDGHRNAPLPDSLCASVAVDTIQDLGTTDSLA